MPENISQEGSLAIIGDEDLVVGFKALGFKVYPIQDFQDHVQCLTEAVNAKAAICLVQDDIYSLAQEFINSYRSLALPVFIPFSKSAKKDLLEGMVRQIRLKATGAL